MSEIGYFKLSEIIQYYFNFSLVFQKKIEFHGESFFAVLRKLAGGSEERRKKSPCAMHGDTGA